MHMDCFMNRCALESDDTSGWSKDEYIPLLRSVYNLHPVWSPSCHNPAGENNGFWRNFEMYWWITSKITWFQHESLQNSAVCIHLFPLKPISRVFNNIYLLIYSFSLIYMSAMYNKEWIKKPCLKRKHIFMDKSSVLGESDTKKKNETQKWRTAELEWEHESYIK